MNTKKTVLLCLLGLLVILFGLFVWTMSSPIVQDYFIIHDRNTSTDLAFAFAVALRNNDAEAYEMIDPTMKTRLDDWMKTHRGKVCTNRADTVLLGRGTNLGYRVIVDCFSENRWLSFKIDDIVIKDMKVIGWGDVKEK